MQIEELIARFKPTRTLKTDTQSKSAAILGTVDGTDAICTLEKTAFSNADFSQDSLSGLFDGIKSINNNDVYFWSLANLCQDLEKRAGAKVNFIYPASETHIRKYGSQDYHLIAETPEMYDKVVKPFIDTQKGDRIQWVYNILFEGKEAETFVHHEKDPLEGFVLLPDMKWDGKTMESLYLVAIVNRTDISSIRDVTGEHLPLLQSISKQIQSVVSMKYPVRSDQLRVFVHYQPSYYHFHIHVVNIAHPGFGSGLNVGKAILLDDIMENLKVDSGYYQKRTLHYVLGENHELWESINEFNTVD